MVNGFYPDAHEPHLRLSRFSLFNWFAVERWDQTNYIASVDLEPGRDGQPGHIRIGKPHQFGNDSESEDSTFVQILGTRQWAQLLKHRESDVTVIIHDANGSPVRTLTSFKNHTLDPDTAGFAVSRSGHYLLVVDAQRVILWDLANQRIVDSESNALLDVRRFLASNRGSTGNWWITDNLRYVIIEPSQFIEERGGSYGTDKPMYMPIPGMQVDVQQSGVAFDRAKRTVAAFPAELDGQRVVDAEDIGGKLQLLYGSGNWTRGITIADASGHPLATHRSESGFAGSFVRWTPERNELWSLGGSATFWLGHQEPNSEATIGIWDYAHDANHLYKLTLQQVQSSLSGAN